MKKIIWCICVLVAFSSCATQKSKSDQSGFSKFYHNTNAKFNGYFNANELVEESVAQLNLMHSDNYNELLPIYKYRAAANPESVAANLDEAIKKVSVVATIHDNSIWVDDCYLLIGKSEYLKQDFESAENALEFFMHEFEPDGSRSSKSTAKKRKKKKSASASSKRSTGKSDRQKESDRRAKEAEKERKAYNKALRKKQKKSAKGKSTGAVKSPGSTDNVASKRNTTRATPTPEAQEKPEKDEAAKQQNPGDLKHRPAYQEAKLWLARTYIERENYPRVEFHMNGLKNNPYLQDEVRVQIPAVEAYYAISRDNFKGAIPHLEKAIEVAKKKTERARYAYILGQIMDLEDESSGKSYAYYKQAYDYHPGYELAFNAELSMARTAYLTGEASLKESILILERMLADDKNEEYKDKLYFTYARIDLFLNDTDAAIGHLNDAIAAGGANQAQATETYYLLATLYFDKSMYIEAKAAYDAALQTMSKEDDRHEMAQLMSDNLTDIALHLSTIALQDSLLGISQMSEEEKLALAKDIKSQKKIAAIAASLQNPNGGGPAGSTGKGKGSRNQLALSTAAGGGPGPRQVSAINNGQSSFFAYDDRSVKRGTRDFDRVWGGRPLSDNWRVKSKQAASAAYADSETPDLFSEDQVDEDDLADYFKDVPDTDEEIAKAHQEIQNAMLQLGSLYREKLEDAALSVKVLEELISRYPDSPTSLESYYQLYLSYILLNNDGKAEYYKNLIIEQFPESKYALALSDPDYINKQLTEERKLELKYEGIYNLVEEGKYQEAMDEINSSRTIYGTQHAFQSKIAIMEAMCIGNLQGRDEYIGALKRVVSNFPNTPEETKARDMLLLLGAYKNNRLNLQQNDSGTSSGPRFRSQPNAVHYMLVSITNFKDISTKDAKISVSNYHRKYHKLDRLKISSLVFDPKTGQSLILVRSFKNSVESMKYYTNIFKHIDEYLPEGINFEVFPVSQFNYREIIKERSLESYKPFFEEQYVDDN